MWGRRNEVLGWKNSKNKTSVFPLFPTLVYSFIQQTFLEYLCCASLSCIYMCVTLEYMLTVGKIMEVEIRD